MTAASVSMAEALEQLTVEEESKTPLGNCRCCGEGYVRGCCPNATPETFEDLHGPPKPCSARITGSPNTSGWCLLADGHEGQHEGALCSKPSSSDFGPKAAARRRF